MLFYNTKFLKTDEIVLKLEQTTKAEPAKNWVPAYHFKIFGKDGTEYGYCNLRVGYNDNVYYGGNIGYGIHEQYRGNHYAAKACLLLLELAKKHKMTYLIITCNTDNFASRKTCEYAGGVLKEIANLPSDNEMYLEGARQKCIYNFTL